MLKYMRGTKGRYSFVQSFVSNVASLALVLRVELRISRKALTMIITRQDASLLKHKLPRCPPNSANS